MKVLYVIFVFAAVFFVSGYSVSADEFERERTSMVRSQIHARGIRDGATLDAMRAVPRHLYVPYAQRRNAYHDRPLPIGYGQTISQPYIVAYMTEIVNPKPNDKMLEIGTGSGYQAAVLAEIIDEVYTIEIVRPLGEQAKRLLESQYDNVHVKIADGYHGWPEHAPYNAIVVTAAAEYIPPPLVEQLKEGGKMIIPVGSPFQVQQLMLVEKNENGEISTRSLMPVRFVPFERARE